MSKFKSCMSIAMGKSISHAWIALHRCVEANARLTGEPFHSIFQRLEKQYGFKRNERAHWPDSEQIRASVKQLDQERAAWLDVYNDLIDQRKTLKKQGIRQFKHDALTKMCARQNKHSVPKVGFWGWKSLRERNQRNV